MVFQPCPKPIPKEKKLPKPLKRTELKRSKEYKIPRQSDKEKKRQIVYSKVRKEYLAEHEICEYPGCQALAIEIHHTEHRQKNFLNTDTWKALCRPHHVICHDQNIKL